MSKAIQYGPAVTPDRAEAGLDERELELRSRGQGRRVKGEVTLKDGEKADALIAAITLESLRETNADEPEAIKRLLKIAQGETVPVDKTMARYVTNQGEFLPVVKPVLLNAAAVVGDQVTLGDPFMGPDQDPEVARSNHRILEEVEASRMDGFNRLVDWAEEVLTKRESEDDRSR